MPRDMAGGTSSEFSKRIALIQSPDNGCDAQNGAALAMRDSAYALCLFISEPQAPHVLAELRRFVESHAPCGIILVPPYGAIPAMTDVLDRLGCPHVSLSPDLVSGLDCLCSNDRQAAADMVNYLVALGHRRIAFIAGADDCPASRERELGYLDALAEHELDRGADLVGQGDGSFASGIAAARLLLTISPRPTAIFAACDAMAAGAMQAAHDLEIAIPRSLSIAGFDDTPTAAQLWPPLTSVRLPVEAMAFTAVMKLIDPVAAEKQPIEFFGEIMVRASTGPAPG